MKRSALFTLVLLMSAVLAFGQAAVTPSGQATTTGIAVPVAPYSPPLLVTPIVHLSTASTVPGSNGGAVVAAEPPTAPGIRAEIQYGQPVVYMGAQPAATEQATAPSASAGAGSGQPAFDSGVTANGAVATDNGLDGRSLGEVARELRQRMQNANARVYTNSDVTAMPNAGGITGTNASAQQFPPNGAYPVGENGVIRQNGQQMNGGQAIAEPQNANGNATPTQPATEQPQQRNPFQPQVQPMNQANPAAPESNPQAKPGAATPAPPQMSQAQVPPSPADQNAAEGEAQQGKSQKTLPKSGSLLPLIALVGAGATIAGLMARK